MEMTFDEKYDQFRQNFKNLDMEDLEYIIQIFRKNELLYKVRETLESDDTFLKKTLNGILKERIRNIDFFGDDFEKYNYYDAWKLVELYNDIKDIFGRDEVDLMQKLKLRNLKCSAFISHFSICDKMANELRRFLDFYNVPTFTDDEDLRKNAGQNLDERLKKEIEIRPILISMQINVPPVPYISNELRWFEEKMKEKLLRINILLQKLSNDNSRKFNNKDKDIYLNYYEDGIGKTFNYVIVSLLKKLENDVDMILNSINPEILKKLENEPIVRVVANQEDYSKIIEKNSNNNFYEITHIPNTIYGAGVGNSLGIYTVHDSGGSKVNFSIKKIKNRD